MGNRSVNKVKRKRKRLSKLREHMRNIRVLKRAKQGKQLENPGTTLTTLTPIGASLPNSTDTEALNPSRNETVTMANPTEVTEEVDEDHSHASLPSNTRNQFLEPPGGSVIKLNSVDPIALQVNETVTMATPTEVTEEVDEDHSHASLSSNTRNQDDDLVIELENENEFQPICGRRLVDINYLLSQLQEKGHHSDLFDCKAGYFKLVGEKRRGLISKFKFECNMCRKVVIIESEDEKNTHNINANVSACTGIIAAGIGYSQFEELFSAMDIPVFSNNYYAQLQDLVYEKWEETAVESMNAAAEEEKGLAIAEGRIKDGIPLIDVYVDGSWCQRSYGNNFRAMSGAAAIIGKRSGKVLFLAVKNKYCLICARAQKKNIPANEHKCYKNFDGSSSSMEAEIITEGFKASLDMYGIIYARMIADGDSSTYAKILDAKPYKNHTVEKIECRNHVLRNFCNKLRAVAKDTKYSLSHRKTLTNEKIMCMRKAIVKSIKYHNLNPNQQKNISISLLHKDITNSVAHAYGDHKMCSDYNCTKNNRLAKNCFKEIQNSIFLFRINAIIATAATKSRSLIENVDTNAVERFNSVIAKFVGGKRVNYALRRGYQARCSAALVAFNSEKSISRVQKAILGESPRGKVQEIERRRSLKRKLNREHPTKKSRKLMEKSNASQHDYGPTSAAPDMSPTEFAKAKEDFLTNLKMLTADRDSIQEATILQRDSTEWIDIRKKLITASNFGTVCKRQIARSTAPLVKNLLYKKSIANVASVSHGIENEKQALQQIEKQESIIIEPCGLFIDKEYPFIGATPDGLVGKDSLVEVKCPITSFKKGIDAAIKENKIQIYKFNKNTGTKVLNKQSNWYYQIQGQLHVTCRSKCIFGIWSGEKEPVLIEHIYRDDEFWKTYIEKKLVDFYFNCLLPEIVDPRHIRGMPIREITLQKNKENRIQTNKQPQVSQPDPSIRNISPPASPLCHFMQPTTTTQRQLDFSDF